MAAHGAQLFGGADGEDADGGDEERRARPQGDHRRRRMPIGAAATGAHRGCRQARARRAGDAGALRRRRRDLHRRPFLHQAFRLPVADGEAVDRSAAQRSSGDRHRQLRRLRPVRRCRACRGTLPVVLPRRDRAQRDVMGPRAVSRAANGYWLARRPVAVIPGREQRERTRNPDASPEFASQIPVPALRAVPE